MIIPRLPLCSGAVLFIAIAVLHADPAGVSSIVKERDAVLSKIVADLEERHRVGGLDEEAVFVARLKLHSFRRDAAETAGDKIQQQECIVALYEKRLSGIKARPGVDNVDVLRATDALLEARQVLESLRSGAKVG